MNITMSCVEYNRMQEFAQQFVAKPGGTRPILEYIKLTVTGNTAKAEALDGYKAGYIVLNLNDSERDGEMLLPVTGKLKKTDVFAIIAESEKEIEIRTEQERAYTENPKENLSTRQKSTRKMNRPRCSDLTQFYCRML